MDATPMIHLDRVTKVYPRTAVPAVEELTLDVHKGEILILVGPSGCGKSTTLRLINRMIEPSGGHIYFEGEDVTDVNADRLRRRIGYVIQQIGLFPHHTIAENIATVPKMLGWDKSRVNTRVDELLDLMGLEPTEYRDRYPKELSGGQAQELVLQPVPGDRVDGSERLVHQHHRGVRAEGTGDADALRLPAGQLLGVAVAVLRRLEAHEVEQLVDARVDPALVPAEHLGHRCDVLGDGVVREQPDLLDDVADPATQPVGVDVGDVLTLEVDVPTGGLDHAVDESQGGALAAPGRADQDEDLALVHVQGEFLDGRYRGPRIDLGHAVEMDHRCGVHGSPSVPQAG